MKLCGALLLLFASWQTAIVDCWLFWFDQLATPLLKWKAIAGYLFSYKLDGRFGIPGVNAVNINIQNFRANIRKSLENRINRPDAAAVRDLFRIV